VVSPGATQAHMTQLVLPQHANSLAITFGGVVRRDLASPRAPRCELTSSSCQSLIGIRIQERTENYSTPLATTHLVRLPAAAAEPR
jgi:hypothetical protein